MGGEWLGQQRRRTATSHSELSTAWYFRKASEKVVNGRDQLKKKTVSYISWCSRSGYFGGWVRSNVQIHTTLEVNFVLSGVQWNDNCSWKYQTEFIS